MIVEKLSEIISKESESKKYRVMADILRILSLTFGKLWLFEIVGEVNALRRTLNIGEEVSYNECLEAIRELAKNKLISFEEKIRGSFTSSRGEPDLLIELSNRSVAATLLAIDDKIRKYLEIRRKIFEELK